ncbi:hypothetical protein NUW54_g13789 [Trametes sanguinea]|uniref:Uncharacterized protein n=1 Tax=Trametes sanguinea TaxID=158606 RepID=A0ACC1MHM7_9APHY|nr:hypothetical protein NUW54_g13789 [Trametes sanguinea]
MSPVVTSPPKEPCLRCKQSHDTPAAFLMACSKCEQCHVPPVSEQEIINRITADEQGKRHAGLAAWQCKRCTKRQRTDVQPTVNARAPPTVPVERTAWVSSDAGLPSDSLANSRPQSGAPTSADSKTPIPIVIDLDDEIEIVGSHPVSAVANASQISRPSNRLQTSGVPTPPNAAAQSLQSHDLASKDISTPLDKSTREPQKRPHSDTLPAAPEPLPQKPSMHGLPEPLRAHRPGHRQTGRKGCFPPADKRLEPLPIPQPAQPSQPSAYNASNLRHLISDLRAKGKLEPPPTIDYVLDRPSSSKQPSARAVHSGRNLVDTRSEMRDLEAVERKLEDSGDEEAMDVGSSRTPSAGAGVAGSIQPRSP